MNKIEIKVIKASIEHWRTMFKEGVYSEEYPFSGDCPCCQLQNMLETFFNDFSSTCCYCPIAAATGKSSCEGTPWADASDAWERWEDSGTDQDSAAEKPYKKAWRKAAREMIRFLQGLLPKKTKKS